MRKALTFGGTRVTIQTTKNTSDAARAAFGVFCLTTVYPTDTTGVHGNSGDKMARKDVFSSGKGRKWLEMSGDWYFGIVWEQEAQGSSPCTPTNTKKGHCCVLFVLVDKIKRDSNPERAFAVNKTIDYRF